MAVQVATFQQVIAVQPGDNLFRIAALYLGDHTQWNRIAELNLAVLGGVPDPMIPVGAFLTLIMPPIRKSATGGIWGT